MFRFCSFYLLYPSVVTPPNCTSITTCGIIIIIIIIIIGSTTGTTSTTTSNGCSKSNNNNNNKSVLGNETHKLLWDFEIQTDHLISTRSPDLIITKKVNLQNYGLCRLSGRQSKIERKRKNDKYLVLAREKKTVEFNCDGYITCNWCTWYSQKKDWYNDWMT